MHCPNCQCQVAFEKGLFRGTHCKRCNSTLLVSAAYSRALGLLSLCAAWHSSW
jgi:anaerobic ribonucleoside-triphosphate reductase